MSVDPRWPVLGRTDNASFLLADPRIIVVVPEEGCTDDESTARESIAFQHAYWKTHGASGAAIVLMDRVGHQTKEARRVYQALADPSLFTLFGLVSSSVFGRAVASVFMGLARPAVPTRMFGSLAQALEWTKAHHASEHEAHHGTHDEDGDAA